jgi:UDP-N-acetyl-D-mannosaminuronic acid transferase (WecB/TagA/CpsF family)
MFEKIKKFFRKEWSVYSKEDYYNQIWCHAACLTYAEGSKQRAPRHLESLAMTAVWNLRTERDELRRQLDAANKELNRREYEKLLNRE